MLSVTNESKYGVHGYDNMEELMHAIFMAKGPIFNTGKQIKPVNMIDLYNLFCFILDLNCNKNNGSDQLNIWNELFLEKPVPIAHKKGKHRHFVELIHDQYHHFAITRN